MSNFSIGNHDKGMWDAANPIKANKTPSASNLSVDQAIEKAKQTPGADLVVVKSDGKASVHALSVEDSFWDEGKKVLINELDRDPNKKQDMGKTPLAIDNNIASAFSGQGAFLVDEQNKTTYLGDDVDQTTASIKLQDADKFLSNPTKDKVDAAYAIARDAGNERNVDKTIARQGLDKLQQNYRAGDEVGRDVALLKTGETKTKMEGLIGELKGLAGQESQRVAELRGQLSDRAGKYQADLKEPTQKLNAANKAWDQANAQETQAVNKTAYNLREARMPGVYQLEDRLDDAKGQSAQAKRYLDGAIENRVQAQGRVNDLERLPGEAESHRAEARRLESENRGMHMQIKTYVATAQSQVESERRELDRSIMRNDSDLTVERSRPTQPSGGGGSHTSDPFAGGNNGGGSHTSDPFAGGNKPSGGGVTTDPFAGGNKPSGGAHTTDPFAGGNGGGQSAPPGGWRNESRIGELERNGSRLRRERDDLRGRESSLESLSSRLMFTQDIDQLSLYFMNLDPVDRVVMNGYKERHDANERNINQQNRSANEKQNTYNNQIGNARSTLARATSDEESNRSNFAQAEGRVGALKGQLNDLTSNPRPDNHPEVKPSYTAHQKAVEHKEATVGEKAPLTVTRDKAQTVVNDINGIYASDKRELESNIANVQQTLQRDAQSKISQTRNQVAR